MLVTSPHNLAEGDQLYNAELGWLRSLGLSEEGLAAGGVPKSRIIFPYLDVALRRPGVLLRNRSID